MPASVPLLRRPTFLRALSIALAAVFALPSCFTAMVWADDRHREQPFEKKAPELEAFRLRDASGGFVVSLPERARQPLSQLSPGLPPAAKWLRIRPLENAPSVAAVLACSAVQGMTLRPSLELHEEEGRGMTLRFRAWADRKIDDGNVRQFLRDLPGTHREGSFLFSYDVFDAPCAFEPLLEKPDPLGEPIRDLSLVHELVRDDGTSVFVKLAWTPLALVGDVVFLPFEIWAWLATG